MGSGRVLLDEPGVLRISYEEGARVQVHEWLDYNPEDRDALVLDLLDRIYQLLIDYPVEKVLVMTQRARGAFSPRIQAFIREVQFPRLLAETSIRFVATVKSHDALAKMSTELWREQLEQDSRLVTHDVESEREARAWLDRVEQLSHQRS